MSLSVLAGNVKEGKYGRAFGYFANQQHQGEEAARQACIAIDSLIESNRISTLMNTFIVPLQLLGDENSRIHTSINLNTETGRLSSRRPNLQNQPALEKDRYKIRKAFTCEEGNTLIVADYGQLELRLLAHITRCKSMIDAFQKGGDFHSRTAMGMYQYIKDAVDSGEILLENPENSGEKIPTLKEKYAIERRKAKTLNFSIAYGKTAMGLSRDWEVSIEEARETLHRWYADRPEVLKWQKDTIERARSTGYTRTLMGRYRRLPDIISPRKDLRSHSERAAINTPLQGGAADVVMKAMVLLSQNERLAQIGWKMILQIHDEIIFEGPEEGVDEAMQIIQRIMSNPLSRPLLIDLVVDARSAKTWFDAK
jgi:DNA polymerase-1